MRRRAVGSSVTMGSKISQIGLGVARARRTELTEAILGPATARLLAMARIPASASVADVGCGGGAVTLLLSRIVGPMGRVYAIDRCPLALDILKRRVKAEGLKNISVVRADVDEALASIPELHAAYSRFFLMHVPRPRDVLARMRGKLRDGGRLIVEEPVIAQTDEYPRQGLWQSPIALYETLCRLTSTNPNFGREVLAEASAAGFDIEKSLMHQAALAPEVAREYIHCTLNASKAAYIGAGVIGELAFDCLVSRIEHLDVSRIERCSFHTVVQAICSPSASVRSVREIAW